MGHIGSATRRPEKGLSPTWTAYAVWVGIESTLSVVEVMVTGQESSNLVKALITGGVVGLKVIH